MEFYVEHDGVLYVPDVPRSEALEPASVFCSALSSPVRDEWQSVSFCRLILQCTPRLWQERARYLHDAPGRRAHGASHLTPPGRGVTEALALPQFTPVELDFRNSTNEVLLVVFVFYDGTEDASFGTLRPGGERSAKRASWTAYQIMHCRRAFTLVCSQEDAPPCHCVRRGGHGSYVLRRSHVAAAEREDVRDGHGGERRFAASRPGTAMWAWAWPGQRRPALPASLQVFVHQRRGGVFEEFAEIAEGKRLVFNVRFPSPEPGERVRAGRWRRAPNTVTQALRGVEMFSDKEFPPVDASISGDPADGREPLAVAWGQDWEWERLTDLALFKRPPGETRSGPTEIVPG